MEGLFEKLTDYNSILKFNHFEVGVSPLGFDKLETLANKAKMI
jgi:hypothetical protein